jgi:hypothetical protein
MKSQCDVSFRDIVAVYMIGPFPSIQHITAVYMIGQCDVSFRRFSAECRPSGHKILLKPFVVINLYIIINIMMMLNK